jgi:Uncharacterized protein conserved in bacteria
MAAMELLKRKDAAENLIAFTEYTFPRYQTAKHHRIIAGQLERIERGEIDRLMLLVPPRHGKSELASKRLPAWYLGRQPHRQFLSVSATEGLASDFGREVRNIIGSPEYQAIFDTRLAEDSQAKGKWHTSEGGVYYALGIGGSSKNLLDAPLPRRVARERLLLRQSGAHPAKCVTLALEELQWIVLPCEGDVAGVEGGVLAGCWRCDRFATHWLARWLG